MWQEYKAFLFRGNLLELATAFILGVAFNAVVTALADDVIMRSVSRAMGLEGIDELTVGPVLVGTFVSAVIAFLVVATVLFGLIKTAARFQAQQTGEAEEAPEAEDVVLLREIRDLLQGEQAR